MARSKKGFRSKDLTERFRSGNLDEDRLDAQQRFNRRSRHHQSNKTARTASARQAEADASGDLDALPEGLVTQVHSVYIEVRSAGRTWLCVVRKTLTRTSETRVIVGDRVRFREVPRGDALATKSDAVDPLLQALLRRAGPAEVVPAGEGVIERVEPRRTVLTRADVRVTNRRVVGQIPILANAEQMLIVASLLLPRPKWGLIDRMIVAARAGGLEPLICLNKADLAGPDADHRISRDEAIEAVEESDAALAHYRSMGLATLRVSARNGEGLDALRRRLTGRTTALAGHSGVGKSSLISAVEPGLDLKVGEISNYNQKGRHTTTSARIHSLSGGGSVVDTPGVKLFGLWDVTAESLAAHFPDVADGTAPKWRVESYERILQSLAG
jgi:ribosome biogenesis GTPase